MRDRRLSSQGVTLLLIVLIGGVTTTTLLSEELSGQQNPSPTFTFAAAGDHSWTSETVANLQVLNTSDANFYLALGDFSYAVKNETDWCSSFKQYFQNIELIAGNHDTGENTGGDLTLFIQNCPDVIGGIVPSPLGGYAKEYYFDYPVGDAPIARFILISPGILGSLSYNYSINSAHYNWTAQTINDARILGIPWIIVGMHKNCISIGAKSCEIGADLFNLLLTKRVDLILQGHDHNYQRGKQLICAQTGSVNATCIIDDGSDNTYKKGEGSIIVITGTFGAPEYIVNPFDSEAGYFAKAWGSNGLWSGTGTSLESGLTYGFMKFTVNATQITAEYVAGTGSFRDSWSIGPSASPPATPSLSPSILLALGLTVTVGVFALWALQRRKTHQTQRS